MFFFIKHPFFRFKLLAPQTIPRTLIKSIAFSVPHGEESHVNNTDAISSDERRKPKTQPWYRHCRGLWQAILTDRTGVPFTDELTRPLSQLRLITWNIDMSQPGIFIRMESAIEYLKILLADRHQQTAELPSVIFLQEMCDENIRLLKKTKWVQESFYLTDMTGIHWGDSCYGTTILIDKRLAVSDVFRVQYKSEFCRDGLFVDFKIGKKGKVLRLCNTHLESLVSSPPLRPEQIMLAAGYLHASNAHAGVMAGDFNAIQPFDETLHQDNNLQDAFLALGGKEGQHEGFTWGYQNSEYMMNRYPPTRMDKVLFCGKITVKSLKRIGVRERVIASKRDELMKLTDGEDWVTDHYGLEAILRII